MLLSKTQVSTLFLSLFFSLTQHTSFALKPWDGYAGRKAKKVVRKKTSRKSLPTTRDEYLRRHGPGGPSDSQPVHKEQPKPEIEKATAPVSTRYRIMDIKGPHGRITRWVF